MNYQQGIDLALSLGYEKVSDETAYRGYFYIKNGKKWIHNIDALSGSFGGVSQEGLKSMGYDVDAYMKYANYAI